MIHVLVWSMTLLAQAFAAAPAAPLDSDEVLARYADTLNAVKVPALVSFEYTVEQAGLNDLIQSHRIYRSGNVERDETIGVSGKRLSPPLVRIFRGRPDRYAIARIAPRGQRYSFAFVGTRTSGKHIDYVYRTVARERSSFEVTQVTIDGARFLPSSIAFVTTGKSAHGSGAINYTKLDKYWVPMLAVAVADVDGNQARERISFYSYRFPASLPRSTFSEPKPLATPRP